MVNKPRLGRRDSVSGSSQTSTSSKFNLLLLEDGEYFLEDMSVYMYPDPKHSFLSFDECIARREQGRLKICTRSLIFDPKEYMSAIQKFSYKKMDKPPQAELFHESENEYLTFSTTLVVNMKENGVAGPYVYKTQDTAVKYIFSLLHSQVSDVIHNIEPLWTLAHEGNVLNKIDEESRLQFVLEPRTPLIFDSSLLVDFRERPLLQKSIVVDRISPLLKYPGCMMLTNNRVYFQPAQINNTGDPIVNYPYTKIEKVYRRRHMLKQCGLEIFMKDGTSVFFSCHSRKERNNAYNALMKQPQLEHAKRDELALEKWQNREITNFEYLSYLNNEADRTTNDLTQYPVFPWIITDYTSSTFDMTAPGFFRDLAKPMGALNPSRLEYFKQRYESMPHDVGEGLPPPFLYGTHYSTPGYVLFYLVRQAPEYMLCLQNGKFDSPDRLFKSISETYTSCLTNHADLKELIPAFYDTDMDAEQWLVNKQSLDLGTTQKGQRVADVELPPWADSPSDFIEKNRQALESDYVSDHLHEWIDLIFGYKQQGRAALEANNLFYYLSYEGSLDLETVTDPIDKCSFEAQIQEFGQTPKQLFVTPHPSRNELGKTVELATHGQFKPIMDDERLAAIEPAKGKEKKRATSIFSKFPMKSKLVDDLSSKMRTTFRKSKSDYKSSASQSPWNWQFFKDTSWEESNLFDIHNSTVTSVHISYGSKMLFSTSQDTTLKLTDIRNGSQKRTLSCHLALSACAVSNDEKVAFIGSWDNNVYMYSVVSGKAIHKLQAHDDAVSGICAIDSTIITSSWDCTVKVWSCTSSTIDPVEVHIFSDSSAPIKCLAMNFTGDMAIAGTENGFTYLYDIKQGVLITGVRASLGVGAINDVAFSKNARTFTCCSEDGSISIFSVDGIRLAIFEAVSNSELKCFASDGKYAVTGGSDGAIRFWNLGDEKEIFTISGAHDSEITSIDINQDGKLMATGSSDGSIKIWSFKPAKVLHF